MKYTTTGWQFGLPVNVPVQSKAVPGNVGMLILNRKQGGYRSRLKRLA